MLAAEGAFPKIEDNEPHGPATGNPGEDGHEGGDDPTPTLEQVQEDNRLLTEEVSSMRTKLQNVNIRVENLWKANCSLATEFEEVIESKDDEIADLKHRLASRSVLTPPTSTLRAIAHEVMPDEVVSVGRSVHDTSVSSSEPGDATTRDTPLVARKTVGGARPGKAPPVNSFSGEDECIRLDDWLPALMRTSAWNGWTEEDQLIQLAGHLKGRAFKSGT